MTTREGKTVPMVLADDTDLQQGAVEKVHITNLPASVYQEKVWAALVSQSGVADPTAVVLRNDFVADGVTITLARIGAGEYEVNFSSPVLLPNKVQVFVGTTGDALHSILAPSDAVLDETINIVTFLETPAGVYTETDAILNQTAIKIIVYP